MFCPFNGQFTEWSKLIKLGYDVYNNKVLLRIYIIESGVYVMCFIGFTECASVVEHDHFEVLSM